MVSWHKFLQLFIFIIAPLTSKLYVVIDCSVILCNAMDGNGAKLNIKDSFNICYNHARCSRFGSRLVDRSQLHLSPVDASRFRKSREDKFNKEFWYQTGRSSSHTLDLHSGGARFEFRREHRLSRLKSLLFSSVSPEKCQYVNSIRIWLAPGNSFYIHYSWVILTFARHRLKSTKREFIDNVNISEQPSAARPGALFQGQCNSSNAAVLATIQGPCICTRASCQNEFSFWHCMSEGAGSGRVL
jgi:hypothetical protein